MVERVADLVTGRMLDYIEFEADYVMVKARAPAAAIGKPLGETQVRRKFGVTVVGICSCPQGIGLLVNGGRSKRLAVRLGCLRGVSG